MKKNQLNNNAIFPGYPVFVVATIINRIVRSVHFLLDIDDVFSRVTLAMSPMEVK